MTAISMGLEKGRSALFTKVEAVLFLLGASLVIGAFWLPFGLIMLVVGLLIFAVALTMVNGRLGEADLHGERYHQDQDRLGR